MTELDRYTSSPQMMEADSQTLRCALFCGLMVLLRNLQSVPQGPALNLLPVSCIVLLGRLDIIVVVLCVALVRSSPAPLLHWMTLAWQGPALVVELLP